MKLHAIRASHNCRRVIATIEHLALNVQVVEPDMASGALRAPEYLALNPNGKVPTLEDGDFKLWESNAIMQYLASQKPDSGLWPEDARVRADIARWQFWESNHFSRPTGTLAFQRVFKKYVLKQEPDEAAVARAVKDFHKVAPVLNGQLEGRQFIVGDALTLADFSIGANLSHAAAAEMPVGDYPHIQAWWDRLEAVPAWKSTAPKL